MTNLLPINKKLWTDDMRARLRELVTGSPHLSYADIADVVSLEFGIKLTKNSCIGRARRDKIPARPVRPPRPAQVSFKVDPKKARPVPREPRPKRPPPEPVYGKTLIYDLRKDDCRYPYGDVPPYLFCGRPVVKDRSYCEIHDVIVRPR